MNDTNSESFAFVLSDQTDSIPEENIQINQQIYFLTKSLELYEKYKVNHHKVVKQLGHFDKELRRIKAKLFV